MDKLTGKALETFLTFLVAHFREFRTDYAKFTDEQIIAKFKRRHLVDQMGLLSIFIFAKEHNSDTQKKAKDFVEAEMSLDLEEFNEQFNKENNA